MFKLHAILCDRLTSRDRLQGDNRFREVKILTRFKIDSKKDYFVAVELSTGERSFRNFIFFEFVQILLHVVISFKFIGKRRLLLHIY